MYIKLNAWLFKVGVSLIESVLLAYRQNSTLFQAFFVRLSFSFFKKVIPIDLHNLIHVLTLRVVMSLTQRESSN